MSGDPPNAPVILDTCVLVEHFKSEVQSVTRLIANGRAVIHPDVLGEVMLGCGEEREEIVEEIRLLPMIQRPPQTTLESLVEQHAVACKRVGWVDAVLLCTAIADPRRPSLLTFDRKLLREAIRLGVAFAA
jgi:predicted nucleic acid-binding protein